MVTNKHQIQCIVFMLTIVILMPPCQAEDFDKQLDRFQQAITQGDDSQAKQAGSLIFQALKQKYGSGGGFRAYESKLKLAEHLAKQMIKHLRKATQAQMSVMMDDVFGQKGKKKPLNMAGAKSFYVTSLKLFSKPVRIGKVNADHKQFLVQYYDVCLRNLVSQVGRAGQALAVAEPSFKGTYDYVLVFPLLHTVGDQGINTSVLPSWMDKPEHLQELSDSCLLHYGMAYQAMDMARSYAQRVDTAFSKGNFYRTAAKKCDTQYVHTAVDCLKRAYEVEETSNTDIRVAIQFDIVQLWLDTRNYNLAADQTRQIRQEYPDHPRCGNAIYLYYYALSRSSKIRQILNTIDKDLNDPRCVRYQNGMMLIKWNALRETRDAETRLLAVEHEILRRFGDNPIVAPIMFTQAVDCLPRLEYQKAIELLKEVVEKFPQTSSADDARKMLPKIQRAVK